MFRFALLFLAGIASAQNGTLAVSRIPESLTAQANAVIREEKVDVIVESQRQMRIKTHRVVTIFNENGQRWTGAYESRKVRDVSATILDGNGNEIRRFKRKDFINQAVSESSLISDNRVTYLQYTPTQYPYTIVYDSEVTDINTAFIPPFMPLEGYLVSTERSTYSITYPPSLGFRYKEYNCENLSLERIQKEGSLTLIAKDLPAIRNEQYAPSADKLLPRVMFSFEKFHLEGVDGNASTWESFGKWMYDNLIVGTDELPAETIAKIKSLVGTEKDPLKIAQIVYKYVQDKTRYVSISLGIGGWKPMKAKDVDRLGYGDCKALSNYTRALLAAVGVPSYYTVVYSDIDKTDLLPDFVSVQGNHIILLLPRGDDLMMLECTNQTVPFGYLANTTDDRYALMIGPEGGKLVKTGKHKIEDNFQFTTGSYAVSENGNITGRATIKSGGTQYNFLLGVEEADQTRRDSYYKELFSNIANLRMNAVRIKNDRDKLEMVQEIELSSERYASSEGSQLIFPVNLFNNQGHIPQRYRVRSHPFEMQRGYVDNDEVVIEIPSGFAIESKPDAVNLSSPFGEYSASVEVINPTQLRYKRSIRINPGSYDAGEYEKYRKFREQIARNDNSKIVLARKT